VSRLARLRATLAARGARWVRRRQGEDALPLALTRRRLYILPTRGGIGFAVLVAGMVVAGLQYGNSLALLGAFVLAGFGIVAANLCHRNLLDLRVRSVRAGAAFAGETAPIDVELANASGEARLGLAIEALGAAVAVPRIDRGAELRARLLVTTTRRGVVAVDRVRIATRFPFGLFRAWTWLHCPLEIIVFPRPHGTQPAPHRAGEPAGGQSVRATGGDEWRDLRAFRDGDSPRHVAWKAYARGQPLLVKEYGGSARESLRLDLAAARGDGVEARLGQVARWIVDAESRGARYGLALPGREFPEDRGARHERLCLEALARHPASAEAGYE
jgi:uncharacterized protein (DUF58 family)